MAGNALGLGPVPESTVFTNQIVQLPTLREIGFSYDLAGVPVPEILGNESQHMPGSFNYLAQKPETCWIQRSTTVFKCKIPVAVEQTKRRFFKEEVSIVREWVEVEIRSPISGMIIGFRTSDGISFLDGDKLTHSPPRVRGDMYPILLIPEAEPQPYSCGYDQIIDELKRNSYKLMLQSSDRSQLPEGWHPLPYGSEAGQQLKREIEALTHVDERPLLKPIELTPDKYEHELNWLDYLRGQDGQLKRKLKHLFKHSTNENWL